MNITKVTIIHNIENALKLNLLTNFKCKIYDFFLVLFRLNFASKQPTMLMYLHSLYLVQYQLETVFSFFPPRLLEWESFSDCAFSFLKVLQTNKTSIDS